MVQSLQILLSGLLSLKDRWRDSSVMRTVVHSIPASLLFISLCLALTSLDAHRLVWSMWWAIALALATTVWMLLGSGGPILRGRHLLLMIGILTPIIVRAWLSLHGPMPSEGLHEAVELVLIASVSLALWIRCGRHPGRVIWLWNGALAVGWLSAVVFAGRMTLTDPAQASTGPLAAWGIVCALAWFFHRRWQSRQDPSLLHTHPLPTSVEYLIRVVLLAAGLASGLWVSRLHQGLGLDEALQISAGLHVQRYLWLQSVLFGWGHGAMDRLIEVIAQPRLAILPPWGGPISLLAQGGMAGLLALAVLGVVLLWRLPSGRMVLIPRRYVNSIAAPAALFLLGLLATGGPRSSVVLFSLAGWVALAMVPSRIPDPVEAQSLKRFRAPSLFRQRLAIAFPLIIMALASFLLLKPLRARHLMDRADRDGRSLQACLRDLDKARDLNPWEPHILEMLAVVRQKELAALGGWSETAYQKIINDYRAASDLNPYSAQVALALARYQMDNHRDEDALNTAQGALGRLPNAPALINWVFRYALDHNQPRLANQMLDRGIRLLPERVVWWRRRFELASRLGMGPLVSQAGSVSLTADPENQEMVQALWTASHRSGLSTPPVDSGLLVSPDKPS